MKTIILRCNRCKNDYSVYGFYTNNFQKTFLNYKPIDNCSIIKNNKCPKDKGVS